MIMRRYYPNVGESGMNVYADKTRTGWDVKVWLGDGTEELIQRILIGVVRKEGRRWAWASRRTMVMDECSTLTMAVNLLFLEHVRRDLYERSMGLETSQAGVALQRTTVEALLVRPPKSETSNWRKHGF
jgi:hypothetical protein